jgi:hypothetical protein
MSNDVEAERSLIPVEQRTVEFYGDEITAVLAEVNGRRQVYVPIKPICDFMGINWDSQRQRIQRDPVLSEVVEGAVITTAPSSDGRGGGPQEMTCLPLDYINGFLFGITAARVKEDIRERLIRYQRECYQVLADAFLARPFTAETSTMTALVQIRETALAVARMAEEQMALQQRVETTEGRLDRAAAVVGEMGRRIRILETRLSPANALTDEQAADVQQQVAGLAQLLSEHDPTKNHYQAVWAEVRRRFRASSYKTIRQEHYQGVLDFLDSWHTAFEKGGALTDEEE